MIKANAILNKILSINQMMITTNSMKCQR